MMVALRILLAVVGVGAVVLGVGLPVLALTVGLSIDRVRAILAPCPACTSRRKGTKFSVDVVYDNCRGALVHSCRDCGAIWITPPAQPYERWSVTLKPTRRSSAFDEAAGDAARVLSAASPLARVP